MNTLYLLSVGAQAEVVKAHCFTCGKISIGCVNFLGALWFPCSSKDCPIEEKHWDVGPCDLETAGLTHEYRIIVRKLKEENT